MNSKLILLVFGGGLVLAGGGAGCSKSAKGSSGGLEPSKIPAAVTQAFAQSPEETKQAAASYVAAYQGQDAASAVAQLRKARTQANLTLRQREVLAKAMVTTMQQLRVAADSGDAAAKAAWHDYMTSR